MVPPWVPEVPPVVPEPLELDVGEPKTDQPDASPDGPDKVAEPATPTQEQASPAAPAAPQARFIGVRRALGDYGRSGQQKDLRRGLGHYARTGYGGSKTATRRMSGTAVTASSLDSVLSGAASGSQVSAGNPFDPALLAGRSVAEVIDAIVEAVRPVDGTQDAEAGRASIRDSLSELLTRFPDADMLNLSAEERSFVIERYTGNDVFRRFELDVGKTIVEKAPSAITALARLKEAREYIKECVSASFRKVREAGKAVTSRLVSHVVRDALRETFEVFEGYAE